jgi:hypothetical protein
VTERGNLLAPKPVGTTSLAARQPDIFGLQNPTAVAQERGEARTVDLHGALPLAGVTRVYSVRPEGIHGL